MGDHADDILKIIEEGEIGRTYITGGEAELSNLDQVTQIFEIFVRMRPRTSGSNAELITLAKDRTAQSASFHKSKRDELEITSVWNLYLEEMQLSVAKMGRS